MPRDYEKRSYEKRRLGINRSTDYQEYMRRYMRLIRKQEKELKKVKV